MLEFALTAIIVFTLIFGTMLLALALYSYEVVNQYARDASRYAIVHGNGCVKATDGTPCTLGTSGDSGAGGAAGAAGEAGYQLYLYLSGGEAYPGINLRKLDVSAVYGLSPSEPTQCNVPACNSSGDQVAVTVSYPYLYAIPFIRSRSFTMSATSTMTISQ